MDHVGIAEHPERAPRVNIESGPSTTVYRVLGKVGVPDSDNDRMTDVVCRGRSRRCDDPG
jgi:hypothetical protein